MAEPKRIDENISTAELASYGIPAKQPEGPKLVKGQEPETLGRGTGLVTAKRPWTGQFLICAPAGKKFQQGANPTEN
jgi:hypothetical protein